MPSSNNTSKQRIKAPASTGGAFTSYNSSNSLDIMSAVEQGKGNRDDPKGKEKSHSMAYPRGHYRFTSTLKWYLQQNSKAVLATLAFLGFCLLISSDFIHNTAGFHSTSEINFAGASGSGYFSTYASQIEENAFGFVAVTDLDQLTLVEDEEKPTYRAYLLAGKISHDPVTNQYSIEMEDKPREISTHHNEAGRGAEFSELQIYHDRLLTFDDRTGGVFEIRNNPDGESSYVVPRFVVTEGEGDTDKGMKWEWASVKHGELYMGSMGKEYTRKDGSIVNRNNLWVAVLNNRGEIRRENWSTQYNFVRHHLGADSPGYLIHEAINWSPYLNKWVFAPRRISFQTYDDAKDERRGSNKLVLVDDAFTTADTVDVKMASNDGLHGFSSFAFVPGTLDRHALALRSVEEDCAGDDLDICKQRSYFVIFDVLTGEVLMDEVKIKQDHKFEGVEFADIHTEPPPITSS